VCLVRFDAAQTGRGVPTFRTILVFLSYVLTMERQVLLGNIDTLLPDYTMSRVPVPDLISKPFKHFRKWSTRPVDRQTNGELFYLLTLTVVKIVLCRP
jgi:hypothetical protein